MRILLGLVLAAGCSKKCPEGYLENANPHFCVGAPKGYTLEKQEKEKDSDESWSGAVNLKPPTDDDGWSDVWLEWYDSADLKQHIEDTLGTWKAVQSASKPGEYEILKMTDLPGGGRYGVKKVSYPSVQVVQYEAYAVVAIGSRVIECSARLKGERAKSKSLQPNPAFLESCAKVVQ